MSLAPLTETTVQWRGLTLSTDHSNPFGVRTVAGWDELPSSRLDALPRPNRHGTFDASVWADERVVVVTGQVLSRDRDALLATLGAHLTWGADQTPAEPLTITRAGRTLMAWAKLVEFRTPTDLDFGMGLVPFAIQWRCADPLRYSTTEQALDTGFPEMVGGLEYDLFTDGEGGDTGYLEFGEVGSSGRVRVANDGTASSFPLFQVEGPAANGFEIAAVGSGRRVRWEGVLFASDVLVIDPATGSAVLNGVADRSGLLTRREWEPVPPGTEVEYAFLPIGEGSPDARLTVLFRSAWW